MGMQGPLTAQALGRSPYDDIVLGDGDGDPNLPQKYDHRGRPINPETKRINKDMIRSHNEVMLVIGVAEPEHPGFGLEAELQRRHVAHEDDIAQDLIATSRACMEGVGLLGIGGLRQRILVYHRYSHITFGQMLRGTLKDFSFSRDILAGAPAGAISRYMQRLLPWLGPADPTLYQCTMTALTYISIHLELYSTMQRLGLTANPLSLPHPSYFIPFTKVSLIQAPPPIESLNLNGVIQWLGNAAVMATPFIAWLIFRNMASDWTVNIWQWVYQKLPNTYVSPKMILPPPTPSRPVSIPPTPAADTTSDQGPPLEAHESGNDPSPPRVANSRASSFPAGAEDPLRTPASQNMAEEYPSEEEDNGGANATLISFDVEATESIDAPPGLWSAELRPSQAQEARTVASPPIVYFDTLLTRGPPLVATDVLTGIIARSLSAPAEGIVLRLLARSFFQRHGIPAGSLLFRDSLGEFTWRALLNSVGTEVLRFSIVGSIWFVFMLTCYCCHYTEEEWKNHYTEEERALIEAEIRQTRDQN